MSNPRIQPRELIGPIARVPFGYFPSEKESALFRRLAKSGTAIETIQDRLRGLDMSPADSVNLNSQGVRERVGLPSVRDKLNGEKEVYALTNPQNPEFRRRTFDGGLVVAGVLRELPLEGFTPFTRTEVERVVADKFYLAAGPHFTLERIRTYYPKTGVVGLDPITMAEAGRAFTECGLWMGGGKPYPVEELRINPKSDNGLPVLDKWENPMAQGLVMALMDDVEARLRRGAETLPDKGRELERLTAWREFVSGLADAYPSWFTFLGKAKQDYYTEKKINEGGLRFYNVVPRHLQLIMMRVTQAFEEMCVSLSTGVHTTIGARLHHNGAEDWVRALSEQNVLGEFAFVHCGDDSWIISFRGGMVTMFALDCSSFDLTQHAAVTASVHRTFYRALAGFDEVAAGLWFALMRERRVLVAGNVVYEWRHAGPSGMLLQSKVNDVLMHVYITRLLGALAKESGPLQEERVSQLVAEYGKGMGFVVKLEQFGQVPVAPILVAAESVRSSGSVRVHPYGNVSGDEEARNRAEYRYKAIINYLYNRPFLYVGHYFHVQTHHERQATVGYDGNPVSNPALWAGVPGLYIQRPNVMVCCDLPRTLSQMAYPSVKWYGTEEETRLKEAMRLGSQYLSAGMPPRGLEKAFNVWRGLVTGLVVEQLARWRDKPMPELKWAIDQGAVSPDTPASLAGLYRVLQEGNASLWLGSVDLTVKGEVISIPRRTTTGGPLEEPPKVSAELVGHIKRAPKVRTKSLAHAGAPTTSANQGRKAPTMTLTQEELDLILARRRANREMKEEKAKAKKGSRTLSSPFDDYAEPTESESEVADDESEYSEYNDSSDDSNWGYLPVESVYRKV